MGKMRKETSETTLIQGNIKLLRELEDAKSDRDKWRELYMNKNGEKASAQVSRMIKENERLTKEVEELVKAISEIKEQHSKTTGLSFSQALVFLEKGHKIKRKEWGGYWFLVNNVYLTQDKDVLTLDFKQGMIVAVLKNNGGYAPAQPYQADLLAKDYEVID